MDYLGGLRGNGVLLCAGKTITPTRYDLDGYLTNDGQVTCCGEIRVTAAMLRGLFGRDDLQLRTAGGRLLRLRFSEKRLAAGDDAAHVDVLGDLPAVADWRRRSGGRASPAPVPTRATGRPMHMRAARA